MKIGQSTDALLTVHDLVEARLVEALRQVAPVVAVDHLETLGTCASVCRS